MIRTLRPSLILLMLLVLLSCATFSRDSYRILTISQQSYDATLISMGELYREGKISEEQKNQVIVLGRAYKLSHNNAVDVLEAYEVKGGQGNKDAVTSAIENASKALAKLIAYCRQFLEGG